MKVRVNGKKLASLFSNFVGNNKVMFNFTCNGRNIEVQVLEDFTACTTISVESIDNDYNELSTSFWITKAITIIDTDLPVDITFLGTGIYFEQGQFNSMHMGEYEEKRVFPSTENVTLKPAYSKRLMYITHAITSCGCMAKELAIPDPDPVFSMGKVYVDFRKSFFVESMDYPEMCIPTHVLKGFAYKLDDKATYAYFEKHNTVYFKSKDIEFWVPTSNYNISNATISAIEKKMQGCTPVTTISFKDYVDKLAMIASVYPKTLMTLCIQQGSFSITVNTNTARCVVGNSEKESILYISITSAQLQAITKLYPDDDVEILRGGNCIWMRSGEKNMLIAGMLY